MIYRNPIQEIKQIDKMLRTIEADYEKAEGLPLKKAHLMKKAIALLKRLEFLERAINPTGR